MKTTPLSHFLIGFESGSRPRGGADKNSGSIPSLGGEHITSLGGFNFSKIKTIPESYYASLRTGRIRKGDILVVKDGATTGKTALVDSDFPFENAAINEHVFRLEVDRAKACPGFISHFLRSPTGQGEILKNFRGAAIGGINRSFVDEVAVPQLTLNEQKRIAAVLDKADALRRQREESLQLTEKLLQSAFIDMFGDPRSNPKDWDTVSLEELCDKIVDCPHSTPIYSDTATGFYCIRSSDIQNGKLELASTRHVSESIFTGRIARHEPKAGEVIYTREGGRLGFAAQVPPGKRVCLGQRMMLFKARDKVSTNTFLANLLNSESFRRTILNLVGGGAAPRVNIKDLRTIDVYRPPYKLQKRFEKFAESLHDEEESLTQAEIQTQKLFDSLQQRAFRGELELSRLKLDAGEPASIPPVAKVETTDGRIYHRPGSFIAPPEIEREMFALEKKFDQAPAKPRPWSENYFKYRTLSQALLPPFSFAQIWQATHLDMEEANYEAVKDKVFEYVAAGILEQQFDETRKEIVFYPRP